MNLFQRLQFAAYAFRAARGMAQKDASAVVPVWEDKTPQYSTINFNTVAQHGYRRNELIFACVGYRAESTAAATLRVFDQSGGELAQHPARQLIRQPNPVMTEFDFWVMTSAMCDLAGRAYWLKDRSRNGRVIAFYPLRPDRVQPVPSKQSLIGGYQYQNGEKTEVFPAEDVIAFTEYDPINLYTGWSPAQVASRAVDVDNSTTDFIKLFFQNGAMPQGVLSTKAKLNDAAVGDLRRRWKEKYGGFANWAEVAVLDSDAQYQQIGMNFKDMDFSVLDARNEARICMVFRTPPILINAMIGLSRSTYSNYKEARIAFNQDTMAPRWKHFQDEYQLAMSGEFGDNIETRFDLSDVPAHVDMMVQKWEAARGAWKDGLAKRNEARKFAGFDVVEDGDVFIDEVSGGGFGALLGGIPAPTQPLPGKPAPAAPADAPANDQPAQLDQPAKPAGEQPAQDAPIQDSLVEKRLAMLIDCAKSITDEQKRGEFLQLVFGPRVTPKSAEEERLTIEYKKRHAKKRDLIARAYEMQFRDAAQKQMAQEMKAILKVVNGQKAGGKFERIASGMETALTDSKTGWVTTFKPLIKALIADQGDQIAADFGISFDIKNPYVDEFLKTYVPKFADRVLDTTRNVIVLDMLQKAQDDGLSIPDLADLIKGQYQQWDDYRATMIARTETIRSSNAGGLEAIRQAEIPGKQWLSTNDDRTRPDHEDAQGQIVAIDEPFDVGGESLMFPGDPDGSADQTINCRCTVLPVQEGELQKALATRRERKGAARKAMSATMQMEIKADMASQGVIVSLWLSPAQAALLNLSITNAAVPMGTVVTAPELMHITLAYLGKTTELAPDVRERLRVILSGFAAQQEWITGTINGIARFAGEEVDALVALFDSAELGELRGELCEALELVGAEHNTEHGFTAHVTLAYLPANAQTPNIALEPVPMVFDALTLAWGDEHETFALSHDE